MLLNRVLTVRPGESSIPSWARLGGGHRLRDRCAGPPGRPAGGSPLGPRLPSRSSGQLGEVPWVASAHPSRSRRTGASSARGRSAGSTDSSTSRAAKASTGRFRKVECGTIMGDMTDRMPALYIGHGAPPLLDDPMWSGQLAGLGRGPAAPESDPDRQRPLGVRAGDVERQRRSPGLRLRRVCGAVLPDDLRDAARHRARPADRRDDAERASRCTSTPAAVSTTARGCRSRSCTPTATSRCCRCPCRRQDPTRLLALGERLRPLRDEGVLIIGSGFLTHGLPFLTEFRIDAAAPGWSTDFDAWAAEALAAATWTRSPTTRPQAPGMPYAAPDRRALHAAVRHPRRRQRPRGAG